MIKLVIFDRDDTLNVDVKFTFRLSDLSLVRGVDDVIEICKRNNTTFAIATNQSGIGEGFYGEQEMHVFNEALLKELKLDPEKVVIEFCPHPRIQESACRCRKPAPGLLLNILDVTGHCADEAVFIGDSHTDFKAAETAGIQFLKVPEGGYDSDFCSQLINLLGQGRAL